MKRRAIHTNPAKADFPADLSRLGKNSTWDLSPCGHGAVVFGGDLEVEHREDYNWRLETCPELRRVEE